MSRHGRCMRLRVNRCALVTIVSFCCMASVSTLDNGLALVPPMGLSTWSAFRDKVSDSLVRSLADALVSTGMAAAGYNYLLVDDGWYARGCDAPDCLPFRNETGHLNADPAKFPRGLKAVSDYVHAQGLRFGLWFGHAMCSVETNDTHLADHAVGTPARQPDYAMLDAQFFASAGVDAIKHDNCVDVANTSRAIAANFARFQRMGRALNATGRPILYDVVLQVAHTRTSPSYDYGYLWSPELYGPKEAVRRVANSWWSLPVNKYNCWSCCVDGSERIVNDTRCTALEGGACRRGLLPMLDAQDMGTPALPGFSASGHWDWAGPGGWNHIDQLAVCTGESWYGPGFTRAEQVAQMSLWTVLASPLLVSFNVTDPHVADPACLELVTNPRAIAVHQDAAGRPGRRLKNVHDAEGQVTAQVWGRALSGGRVAVVFFNRGEATRNVSATFEEMGIAGGMETATVTVTDVWSGNVVSGVSSPVVAPAVEAHGVAFLVLAPE